MCFSCVSCSPFVEGQPRNFGNEDCGNMYLLEHQVAANDYRCAGMPDSTTAMCSVKVRRYESSKTRAICPNGWMQFNGQLVSLENFFYVYHLSTPRFRPKQISSQTNFVPFLTDFVPFLTDFVPHRFRPIFDRFCTGLREIILCHTQN